MWVLAQRREHFDADGGLVVGVAFLAVAAATIAPGNDVVWSPSLALGVVCLAAAFALDRGDPGPADVDADGDERGQT